MARTTQKASKSTGGTAKRRSLFVSETSSKKNESATQSSGRDSTKKRQSDVEEPPVKRLRPEASHAAEDHEETKPALVFTEHRDEIEDIHIPDNNDVCILCNNGGYLVSCDDCSRNVCSHCIPDLKLLAELSPTDLAQARFRCVVCHRRDTNARSLPYKGITLPSGNRFTYENEKFTKVAAHATNTAQHLLTCSKTMIIQLRLETLPNHGTPARVVFESLKAYYDFPGAELLFRDLPYNLNDKKDFAAHVRRIRRHIVSPIDSNRIERILLFVCTHTDDSSGYPFLSGSEHDSGENGCCSLKEFFEWVITDELAALLGRLDTTCFFLVCGAMIRNPTSRAEFMQTIMKSNMGTVCAFGAKAFIPATATSFILNFVTLVVLGKTPLMLCRNRILGGASSLARQSSVFVIHKAGMPEKYHVLEWVWHQPSTCPWGKVLPLQCEKCGALRTFDLLDSKKARDPAILQATVRFKCKNCSYTFEETLTRGRFEGIYAVPDAKAFWLEYDVTKEQSGAQA